MPPLSFFLFLFAVFCFAAAFVSSKKQGTFWYNSDGGEREAACIYICLIFMRLKKTPSHDQVILLKKILKNYAKKTGVDISQGFIANTLVSYRKKNISSPEKSCEILSKQDVKVRVFLLNALMFIAAEDGIYTMADEQFFQQIRAKIRIPESTFLIIKQGYIQNGLNDRSRQQGEHTQKHTSSFFSEKYWKILDLKPGTDIQEVKKKYRQLAKQYHPDTCNGKNENERLAAQEKFLEITAAYEYILKQS